MDSDFPQPHDTVASQDQYPTNDAIIQSMSELDDAALLGLIDSVIKEKGTIPGAYRAHEASKNHDESELSIQRQWMMASIKRGYWGDEAVAVDVRGRIDVEYGNPGPEISMQQQMTSSGMLSSVNSEEIQTTTRQERYRALSRFHGASVLHDEALAEEWQALDEDDDIHSVSEISALHDEDPSHYRQCSIDCWLKDAESTAYNPLPELKTTASDQINLTNIERLYTYQKVHPNQTRLVCLLPGSYGDPIVCTLSTMNISESDFGHSQELGSSGVMSTYEALSYTWGDPSPAFTILINGDKLLVGNNLFFALQYLRHETNPRDLWIDAISINQQDLKERSEQVVHMLQIYKNASRVIVSLGDESEDSHIAMSSMQYLDQRLQREEITLRTHGPVCYDKLKALYEAQCRLFDRSWFRRSWIRQEVMVAKDIMVICGRDIIGWYAMKRSAARLRRLYDKMTKEDVSNMTKFPDDKSDAIMCLTKGWIYGKPVTKLLGCIQSVWYHHSGGLLDLLIASREYDATDAKDKIYSILGLARVQMVTNTETAAQAVQVLASTVPQFPVDYSKSISDVYQDTVKYFINRDKNLDILSILLTHRNTASDVDLPSWVPDWRVPVSQIPLSAHWDFISMKLAAGGFKVQALPQSLDERGVLRAQGYIFDTVHEVHDYSTGVHSFLSTLDEEETNEGSQPREFKISAEIFDPQKHRTRTGLTATGNMCLVPSSSEKEDFIAILLGSKLPFVLRLVDPSVDLEDANAAVKVTVVGPCIVPEIMCGMLVRQANEHNIPPTEFHLV